MAPLSRKKLFLFDIDGTLAVGDTLYPGSRGLLEYIESIGGKACFITNNSTISAEDYIRKFHDSFHLETTADQFITSGYMTLRFLKAYYASGKILVLGTKSFLAELRRNHLHITEKAEEDISCVVVAYDSELTYEKLTEACKALFTRDIPFYGTNPDLRCPVDFGFVPDCGSICNMIAAATGKEPVYLGKPGKEVVELCLENTGYTLEETLVVGDRLYTDIACGINGGADTCVVYTGEATPEEVQKTPYKPTYAFDTIQGLLDACREKL